MGVKEVSPDKESATDPQQTSSPQTVNKSESGPSPGPTGPAQLQQEPQIEQQQHDLSAHSPAAGHALDESSLNQSLQNTHVSIDINDTKQLEAMGLKRVQIEGFQLQNEDGTKATDEDQEFLLDEDGNIYDLSGNFVATMGNEEEEDTQKQ